MESCIKHNTTILTCCMDMCVFNAIFAFLAVLLIIAHAYKQLTFLPVVIANMIIGIVQQLRSKKVLDKLALLDVSTYVAIRDG